MTLAKGRLTISIVLFKNDPIHIKQLCDSLLSYSLPHEVYFFDNSPTNSLSHHIEKYQNYHYHWDSNNIGYGSGHNAIIKKTLSDGDYHLAMNADIFFKQGTLEKITEFMDGREDIGLLLPRVLNPDHSEQPLYKLLPRPWDLLLRRFLPGGIKKLFEDKLKQYCMSFADELSTFDAPYLSGCFMFLRKEALRSVGGFDPRFFMYCEDVDLSRRIRQNWRTTYYSEASIYHYFYKGSYKELRLLYHHMVSAMKYFNKYGWFNDPERDQINKETIDAFSPKQDAILHTSTR